MENVIHLWLGWVFIAGHRLPLIVESRACSSLRGVGPLITGPPLISEEGLIALLHVGSSQTRAGTHVPGTGKRILNQWTSREVLEDF